MQTSAGVCRFHPGSVHSGSTWQFLHFALPLKSSSPRAAAAGSKLPAGALAGEGEFLPFADASYDTVLCCDVLEHIECPIKVIVGISRVLKPNGIFVYDTINRTLLSRIAVIGLFQQCHWTSCAPRIFTTGTNS